MFYASNIEHVTLKINFAYCLNHLLHLLIQTMFSSKQKYPHTVPDISHAVRPGANAIYIYFLNNSFHSLNISSNYCNTCNDSSSDKMLKPFSIFFIQEISTLDTNWEGGLKRH